MKKLVLLLWVLGLSLTLAGQEYKSAAGIRLAAGGMLTYKNFLDETYALEGILSIRWGGVAVHALVQKYQKFENQEALSWYYGGGLHLGYHGRNNVIQPEDGTNDDAFINLGADLCGGVEYRLQKAPIHISLDYIPSFYFTGERWFVPEGFGLSARYQF